MKKLIQALALSLVAMLAAVSTVEAQTSIGPVVLDSTTCPGSGCVTLGVDGTGSAVVQIARSTGTWELLIEGSLNGVDYDTLSVSGADGSGAASSATGDGTFIANVAGMRVIRVRVTSWTSGSATIWARAVTAGGGSSTSTGGGGGGDFSIAAYNASFGTAGSADTQVQSVQGIASMTPLSVTSNGANIATETTAAALLTSANFAAAFGTAGSADTQVMSVQGIASGTALGVTGAITPADNFANPTTAITVFALTGCWDGATWDRCTGSSADTELSAAAAASDNFANPTTGGVLAFNMVWDGATWDRAQASTSTERAHGTAVTATSEIGGWGLGLATAHGANPTAEAAGDASLFRTNRAGVPFFIGGHPNSITREVVVADADGPQTGTAIVSVSAGTKIVVTRLTVTCSAANTSDVSVRVGFDTDATFAAVSTTGTSGFLLNHPNINDAAGGGVTLGDGSGILGVGADDEDLRYTMSDPAGGSCSITTTYYTIES